MIITTTNNIEGKRIIEYKGVVFGEVISGIDFIKDFTAGLTNIFGGRSGSYEQELIQARYNAMQEMPVANEYAGIWCGKNGKIYEEKPDIADSIYMLNYDRLFGKQFSVAQ